MACNARIYHYHFSFRPNLFNVGLVLRFQIIVRVKDI